MNKDINYESLIISDKMKTPAIITLPILFYIAGTAILILSFKDAWVLIGLIENVANIIFGLVFSPVILTFSFKALSLLRKVRTTIDGRVQIEMSRYFFKLLKPDVEFAESRKWFLFLYYFGFVYAGIVGIITASNWVNIC